MSITTRVLAWGAALLLSSGLSGCGANLITGLDARLDGDFVPLADSPVLNQTLLGRSTTLAGAYAPNLSVMHQYKEGVGAVRRPG